jgi:hypothetical protein
MRDLNSTSDNYACRMIIISDNAIGHTPPSKKKRRTPQRSVSPPLHNMSRWDPPSRLADHDTSTSSITSLTPPVSPFSAPNFTSPQSMSRWGWNSLLDLPSPSTETTSVGRASARILLQPVRQESNRNLINVEKYGANANAFRRRTEDTVSNALPTLSLR